MSRRIIVAPAPGKVCLMPDRRDATGRMRRLKTPTKVTDSAYWRRRIHDGGCMLVVETSPAPEYTPDEDTD